MCVPHVSPRERTVDYTLCSKYLRATINILLLNVLDDVIENAQDFVASVTLSEQGKNHGLGHNNEAKCSELFGRVVTCITAIHGRLHYLPTWA